MKRIVPLLSVCLLFAGDTTAPPRPPPRRSSYHERFIKLCLQNPDPDVRCFGMLLERRVFALVTHPSIVTLPRIGFGFDKSLQDELKPTIFARAEYLRDASDLAIMLDQIHEVAHWLQFYSELNAGTINFEEWLMPAQAHELLTPLLARRNFDREVEAYHKGARMALELRWWGVHPTIDALVLRGPRALAHRVAQQYAHTGRYSAAGIDAADIHTWADEYAERVAFSQ
jgi:hypothetical protein